MGKRRNIKKTGGMVKLKIAVEKLQKSLLRKSSNSYEVPEDVKEGHFAVIAEDGDHKEAKRFVVPLTCLTHPTFLRLLEQAAEEYGFDQEGAITIPCRPSQLETILADQQWHEEQGEEEEGHSRTSGVTSWNKYSRKPMVQTY